MNRETLPTTCAVPQFQISYSPFPDLSFKSDDAPEENNILVVNQHSVIRTRTQKKRKRASRTRSRSSKARRRNVKLGSPSSDSLSAPSTDTPIHENTVPDVLETISIAEAKTIPDLRCTHLEKFVVDGCTKSILSAYKSHERSSRIQNGHPKCIDCRDYFGRLHRCLYCAYIGCFVKGHIQAHCKVSNHILVFDIDHDEVFCSVCNDYVYNIEVDRAIQEYKSTKSGGNAPPGSPFFTEKQDGLIYDNSKPILDDGLLGIRGMYNMGNTCFMSVVLQSLVNNKVVSDFFLAERHNHRRCNWKSSPESKGVCIGCDMDILVEQAFTEGVDPLLPANFLFSIWRHANHLAGYEQHDAHEFFMCLLDGMHQSFEGSDKNCRCMVHDTFFGQLRSEIKCTNCGYISSSFDPFCDISLNIKLPVQQRVKHILSGDSSPVYSTTLHQCLRRFTHPEELSERFSCSKCKIRQKSIKQLSIERLPKVLCLHLKRFEHSESESGSLVSSKITAHVEFPFVKLDLTPYLSRRVRLGTRSNAGSKLYDLFAFVVHAGQGKNLENGHYITYVKRDGQWYQCDDEWVLSASKLEVEQCAGYMLFYQQEIFDCSI
eukprot:171761_1